MTAPAWFRAGVRAAIRAHALAAYPRECCGVVKDGDYIRCRNVAADPENGFRIAARRLAGLLPVDAIVHSHPDGPDCPSAADMVAQEATGVPWIIVSTDGRDCLPAFAFGDGAPVAPLAGRGFRHGVTDCYSLIRDWYAAERGVTLPVGPRDWEWWQDGGDLYRQNFGPAGFTRLPDGAAPEPGDVFLAQTPRSPVPNHGGVYLGRGLALHHLTAKKAVDPSYLSRREAIARWMPYVTHWLRYAG